MPYQSLLDGLVRSVAGAQGALLMDATGEVVVQSGAREDRHRLIGAYQGIALGLAQRSADRHDLGAIRFLLGRYGLGHVILRPLKDGYYIVVTLGPDANVSQGVHRSGAVQERMNREL